MKSSLQPVISRILEIVGENNGQLTFPEIRKRASCEREMGIRALQYLRQRDKIARRKTFGPGDTGIIYLYYLK